MPPYITPQPYSGPSICGVEVIYHITYIEDCPTPGAPTTTSTSTLSTLNRPIWNTCFSDMPDYVGALSSAHIPYTPGLGHFLTVLTTVCEGSASKTKEFLPIVKTCSTASPITLPSAAPWATTPTAGSHRAFPAPTVASPPHSDHPAPTGTAAITGQGTGATTTTTTASTTETGVLIFKGAASGGSMGISAWLGLVAGMAIMLL